MSTRGATELRVGVFALAAIAATVYFSMATRDNPFKDEGYVLHARMKTAEGLKSGSAVEMAGVRIGAVDRVRVEESLAVLDLAMSPGYRLPIDSRVTVAQRGILGDTVLKVSSGTADVVLKDGDWIEATPAPPNLAELQSQLSVIATDIQAITGSLRTMLDTDETRGVVQSILSNINGFTGQLTGITRENRDSLGSLIENIRVVTEQLRGLAEASRPQIEAELESIKIATDSLGRSLQRVENIAAKIDEGEGTIGQLINDDSIIESLTATAEDIGDLVSSVNRFHIDVYYRGEFHLTHDLNEGLSEEERHSFGGKNLVGLRIRPRPDYWYIFEFVDDPLGNFSEEFVYRDVGGVQTEERVINRTRDFQFTFQFAKRFRNLVLRLGIKENAGGIGADLLLLHGKLGFSLDVYDFRWASWPHQRGVPNLKVKADISPIKHLYFTVGTENLINGIIDRRFTWFVGAGIWFTDNDIKWILSSLGGKAL